MAGVCSHRYVARGQEITVHPQDKPAIGGKTEWQDSLSPYADLGSPIEVG